MLRIREAREARGWTQEQLASALATTQQTVQRWESGAVDPKASVILGISEALGITVSYLVGTDDPPSARAMTDDERRLLEMYNGMDATGRAALLDNAAFLYERHPLNTGTAVRSA